MSWSGLKKNLNFSVEEKRAVIDSEHAVISIDRQCALLGLSRSAYYYQAAEIDPFDLALMKQIDEQYTRTPFYGVLRMTAQLRRDGHRVNPKRTRRLMRLMGLEAVYPKPNLSFASAAHPKFPYLLKGLTIDRPNQVWSADITYIRLQSGFIYLIAIIDWFSRYVLSWEISTTLDKEFCLSALQTALAVSSPEIFNTDQGVQFTSSEFVATLQTAGIRVSMDGRGRAFDNIFVERLWRSVKYEEVYLHSYQTVCEARLNLQKYFHFYNTERLHQALEYRPPCEIYFKEGLGDTPIWASLRSSIVGQL